MLRLALKLLMAISLGSCASHRPEVASAPSIVGDWASPPAHGRFMRFTAEGKKMALALSAAGLGQAKTTGTWRLEDTRLTFTNLTGACSDPVTEQVGVYAAQLTATSIAFKTLEDRCEARMSIDGETWTRLE